LTWAGAFDYHPAADEQPGRSDRKQRSDGRPEDTGIRGRAHALAGRPAEARADLLEAYATASRQGAHLFALRAAMALVSGAPPLDPAPAARARLAATYALFTEGHHLDDLVACRRRFDEAGRRAV
jgi:predicted ATPase